MKPPPFGRQGRSDSPRVGLKAPSQIDPVSTPRISLRRADMAYEDARLETIRAYQAKAIDEAERAKLRQRLIAEMKQRERREYEGKKRRRQKPKSAQALREYHRKANRKYKESLQEAEQRINAILAKRQQETETEAEQRRRQAFTAENAHQHHLADQADRYLDNLLDQYFPLPPLSELDYLSPIARNEYRYVASEFRSKELE